MGAIVLLRAEDARVVTVALQIAELGSLVWRFCRALPVGRAIVERVGEIDDLAVCGGIGHGLPVLRKQE